MPKVLIIADDLTGAADCGAAFAESGMETVVLLGPSGDSVRPEGLKGAKVVAIDADTRGLGPEQAAEAVTRIVHAYEDVGPDVASRLTFKKIDSTLRGNVAAELRAVLSAMRAHASPSTRVAIVFAPAFPACGRTTVSGRQLVNGRLLEDSDVWRRARVRPRVDIAAMLEEEGLSSALLELEQIRAGGTAVDSAMRRMTSEADVVICDAETDADLGAISRAGVGLDGKIIWTGAAGLARQLAGAPKFSLSDGAVAAILSRPNVEGPALFVVGTPAAASREQAGELAAASANISVFDFAPSAILRKEQSAETQEQAALACEHLRQGRDVLVQLDSRASCATGQGRELARSLARMIAPCANHVGALFAAGGETARAILDAWGIQSLRLRGEVDPGLPYSLGQCDGRDILILTKAGGFGTRDTLLRCRAFIHSHAAGKRFADGIGQADMHKPIIAITMGDAAGVGPEIIVKSLARREVYERCRPLVIGDAERLRQADRICATGLTIHSLSAGEIDQAAYQPGRVECVDLKLIPPDLPWGKLSAQGGEGAYQYLAAAAKLAMDGKVGAICTAPLNKEALQAAGHKFPGHTELLAHLTGTGEVSMMLTTPKLRVLHVTTHIGLIDAIAKVEPGLVERTIARGHAALEKSGIANPRVGVCGINPHAGENGLFGHGEEEEKIVPAINACRERGWNVEGPLPADTLFYRAQRGDFDLVIAMYHDQGHGPVKVLGLESGVNITIGLPVVRTSVDHGTAFDIAGTGKADERSLLEAIREAVQLAPRSTTTN
jgi:4-hydroxythreonine-4-phosphate dehydrogenase